MPDLCEVDATRERTPQYLGQARDGGQHRDRIAMDEHPLRIRIHGADVIQRKHMIGGLEDPPPPRRLGIQMLQETPVESVRLHVAMMLQPALIARHAVDAVVTQALEYLRGDVGAFLRLARRHLVEGVELGSEEAHQIELGLHLCPVDGFPQTAGHGGVGVDQAPGEGGRDGGVTYQQAVQEGRAAARHAGDEDRPFDGPREQRRILALASLELQEVVQAAADLVLHRVAPEIIEVALRVAGSDQAPQRQDERGVVECLPPGALERRGKQHLGIERRLAASEDARP